MRLLGATLCAAAALAAAPASASARDSLAVTFSGTGASERASMSYAFTSPPSCSMRTDVLFEARDVAWRAEFWRVALPRKRGATSRGEGDARVTGTARMHSNEFTDPGCGYSDFAERDCTTAMDGYIPAKLAVRKLRRGYRVTAELLGSAGSEDEDFAAVNEDCTAALRGPAFRATAIVRPKRGRAIRRNVSSADNAEARRKAVRPHYEREESDSDAGGSSTSRYVSDVAWNGRLEMRRVAAGPPQG